MPDRVTLKIPRPLYERLKRVIEGTGCGSVNEFVVYVLRNLISEHPRNMGAPLTEQETELVRKRLRKLGYLE